MATLTDAELSFIKTELLDNVLDIGALPYFDIRYVYDVVRENVTSSSTPATSSSTAVTAAGPVTLTLADVTGLAVGTRVVIDVDSTRETVTVRGVSGLTISIICNQLHSGTYPVEIESALTLVRAKMADITALRETTLRKAVSSAGIKAVDEIQFFGGSGESTRTEAIREELDRLREELASMLGLGRILREARGRMQGGNSIEVY